MAGSQPPRKDPVDASRFFELDLRTGRVVAVEPFAEARAPAYKLTVDFGPAGTLRTSAQVTNYAPESLEGRLVVGAINLGSKRVAGFKSEFLVLGAVGPDGLVRLLSPDEGARPGDPVA